MASFSDKPKVPLLGNGGGETHASLGTWKAQMSSTLVRHSCGVFASMDPRVRHMHLWVPGTWKAQMPSTLVRHSCGVFASMDPSKMPDTYPSKPKQAAASGAQQQRYEEPVETFEGKFNIKGEDKWQLEAKSQLSYALHHEAVFKNPKLPGLIDRTRNQPGARRPR